MEEKPLGCFSFGAPQRYTAGEKLGMNTANWDPQSIRSDLNLAHNSAGA